MRHLHSTLLDWYDANKRELPWRLRLDPYAVWVSEVMLQQTQVATVLPYYERWMERFPTVEALASADEQEALALWQGLGYYRRCRLLLEGARYVRERGIPSSANDWLKVPGVGRYTAAAIASISEGEAAPLVDGNVERVFARLTASSSGSQLSSAAWQWAGLNMNKARPGDWNQALMELGATICRPRAPLCQQCPLAGVCAARIQDRVEEFPTARPAQATVTMEQIVCIPHYLDTYGIEPIPPGEWWQNMWTFPRCSKPPRAHHLGSIRHQVTHHRITLHAYLRRVAKPSPRLRWATVDELAHIPMPSPQRRILQLALAATKEQ